MTVLNRLLPMHLSNGLWLNEDDHGIVLMHDTEQIAHWGIYGRIEEIQAKATEWLEKNRRNHAQ